MTACERIIGPPPPMPWMTRAVMGTPMSFARVHVYCNRTRIVTLPRRNVYCVLSGYGDETA
jgi:hypothetical protein